MGRKKKPAVELAVQPIRYDQVFQKAIDSLFSNEKISVEGIIDSFFKYGELHGKHIQSTLEPDGTSDNDSEQYHDQYDCNSVSKGPRQSEPRKARALEQHSIQNEKIMRHNSVDVQPQQLKAVVSKGRDELSPVTDRYRTNGADRRRNSANPLVSETTYVDKKLRRKSVDNVSTDTYNAVSKSVVIDTPQINSMTRKDFIGVTTVGTALTEDPHAEKSPITVSSNGSPLTPPELGGSTCLTPPSKVSYAASVTVCSKVIQLGVFQTAIEAASAHDRALIRATGPANCLESDLNFDIETYAKDSQELFSVYDFILKRQLFGSSWLGPRPCDFGFLVLSESGTKSKEDLNAPRAKRNKHPGNSYIHQSHDSDLEPYFKSNKTLKRHLQRQEQLESRAQKKTLKGKKIDVTIHKTTGYVNSSRESKQLLAAMEAANGTKYAVVSNENKRSRRDSGDDGLYSALTGCNIVKHRSAAALKQSVANSNRNSTSSNQQEVSVDNDEEEEEDAEFDEINHTQSKDNQPSSMPSQGTIVEVMTLTTGEKQRGVVLNSNHTCGGWVKIGLADGTIKNSRGSCVESNDDARAEYIRMIFTSKTVSKSNKSCGAGGIRNFSVMEISPDQYLPSDRALYNAYCKTGFTGGGSGSVVTTEKKKSNAGSKIADLTVITKRFSAKGKRKLIVDDDEDQTDTVVIPSSILEPPHEIVSDNMSVNESQFTPIQPEQTLDFLSSKQHLLTYSAVSTVNINKKSNGSDPMDVEVSLEDMPALEYLQCSYATDDRANSMNSLVSKDKNEGRSAFVLPSSILPDPNSSAHKDVPVSNSQSIPMLASRSLSANSSPPIVEIIWNGVPRNVVENPLNEGEIAQLKQSQSRHVRHANDIRHGVQQLKSSLISRIQAIKPRSMPILPVVLVPAPTLLQHNPAVEVTEAPSYSTHSVDYKPAIECVTSPNKKAEDPRRKKLATLNAPSDRTHSEALVNDMPNVVSDTSLVLLLNDQVQPVVETDSETQPVVVTLNKEVQCEPVSLSQATNELSAVSALPTNGDDSHASVSASLDDAQDCCEVVVVSNPIIMDKSSSPVAISSNDVLSNNDTSASSTFTPITLSPNAAYTVVATISNVVNSLEAMCAKRGSPLHDKIARSSNVSPCSTDLTTRDQTQSTSTTVDDRVVSNESPAVSSAVVVTDEESGPMKAVAVSEEVEDMVATLLSLSTAAAAMKKDQPVCNDRETNNSIDTDERNHSYATNPSSISDAVRTNYFPEGNVPVLQMSCTTLGNQSLRISLGMCCLVAEMLMNFAHKIHPSDQTYLRNMLFKPQMDYHAATRIMQQKVLTIMSTEVTRLLSILSRHDPNESCRCLKGVKQAAINVLNPNISTIASVPFHCLSPIPPIIVGSMCCIGYFKSVAEAVILRELLLRRFSDNICYGSYNGFAATMFKEFVNFSDSEWYAVLKICDIVTAFVNTFVQGV